MMNETRHHELSNILRSMASPVQLNNLYTNEQRVQPLNIARENGPWNLIIAQHFASAEKLLVTISGSMPEGVTAIIAAEEVQF
jgi:hypothetical protein